MSTLDVEEQVLLALLQRPGLATEAVTSVAPDHFSLPDRGALYVALVRASELSGGEPIDLDDLAESLTEPEVGAPLARAQALELLARLLEVGIGGAEGGAPATARDADERFRFNTRRIREMAEIRGALASAPASATGGPLPVGDLPPAAGATGRGRLDPLQEIEARLRLVKQLREDGLITDEEYAAKRKELLAEI